MYVCVCVYLSEGSYRQTMHHALNFHFYFQWLPVSSLLNDLLKPCEVGTVYGVFDVPQAKIRTQLIFSEDSSILYSTRSGLDNVRFGSLQSSH